MARGIKTVAILASGPSMTPSVVETVRAARIRAVVINDTFRLMPDADVLFAADWGWWNANPDAQAFSGEKYVSEDAQMPGVRYVKPRPPKTGGNSALRAVHLAAEQGAEMVLLFGVDLQDNRLTHWHGDHPEGMHNPTVATFQRARDAWAAYAKESDRPHILNCNPASCLDCFPRIHAREFFEVCHV